MLRAFEQGAHLGEFMREIGCNPEHADVMQEAGNVGHVGFQAGMFGDHFGGGSDIHAVAPELVGHLGGGDRGEGVTQGQCGCQRADA